MTRFSSDAVAFARTVDALEPYLADIVFVGGWAHHLYSLHPTATKVSFEPLGTLDADVAAPLDLKARGDTIRDRLRAAGFHEELKGDEKIPISEYHLGEEAGGFYVEFLAPHHGGDRDRKGNRNVTTVVGGVSAQRLRHLELLLAEPWSLTLGESQGYPVGPGVKSIRIANPVSFIVQKLLVLNKREERKKAKDLLYVHDTFLMFAGTLPSLQECWARVGRTMHPKHVAAFRETALRLFSEVSDLARNASAIAADAGRTPTPTPAELLAACRLGYRRVFGG